MPTPVGHALAGAALYLAGARTRRPLTDWRAGLLCVGAACAADLDFVAGRLAGDWNRFHQGPSHSLAVALVLAVALAGVPVDGLGGFRRRWVLLTAAACSHLALDLVTRDARPPHGIPLFWPVALAPVHSPLELFLNVRRSGLADLLSAATWRAVALEVL
ncbi:MAG: metal-dependent hydrolase, partial [Candidatus Rokuibacteriota bacterium]